MTRSTLPRYAADPKQLREIFSYFPSGVVTLLAAVDGEPHGLVATAFTVGASAEPPLVACAIRQASTTWPLLATAPRLGVSVLAEDHGELARQVAGPDKARRFAGVSLRDTGSTARFVAGAPVWFECSLFDELPAGDHRLILLEVHALGADPDVPPLIFHASAFRRLVPPAPESHVRD